MNEISIIIYKREKTNKEKGTKFYNYYTKMKDNKGNLLNVSVRFSKTVETLALSPYPINVDAVLGYKNKIVTSNYSLPKYGYKPYEKDGKKQYPYIYINNIVQAEILQQEPPKHDEVEYKFCLDFEENQQPKELNTEELNKVFDHNINIKD